jgi:hypothetical protein
MHTVTVPIAAHDVKFHWQLDLFWYAHKRVYGKQAYSKAHAILVDRNDPKHPRVGAFPWRMDVPNTVCPSIYDYPEYSQISPMWRGFAQPLNIQVGLRKLLETMDDNTIIELIDCDMFHFRPKPEMDVPTNVFYVADVYEAWHLHSLGQRKHAIEKYFQNQGKHYNGGFVPIIGRASTFKRIMSDWVSIHVDIMNQSFTNSSYYWWAGMYAFQATCERQQIDMIAQDSCYISDVYPMTDSQYIGHYCVDKRFNKRTFPKIDPKTFEDNPFYEVINAWLKERSYLVAA